MNLETKVLEIRDAATYIPVLAIRMVSEDPVQQYYLSGYPTDVPLIALVKIQGSMEAHYDAYDWVGNRTMQNAHDYIQRHYYALKDGDVVDVEVLLGLRATPKISQRLETPLG